MAEAKKIALIAGVFHKDILDEMIEAAQAALAGAGAHVSTVVQVSGAYELPLAAKMIFEKNDCDGIVVLGAIEKGETLDCAVMGATVSHFLVKLQLKYHKPIGIGIIGPGATLEQMKVRATQKAQQAVSAILTMIDLQKK